MFEFPGDVSRYFSSRQEHSNRRPQWHSAQSGAQQVRALLLNTREIIMERRKVLLGSVAIGVSLAAGLSKVAEARDATQSVQKAIDAFEAALSSRDSNKMMAIWAQGTDTFLLNPRDKEAAIGTEAIKKRWDDTFNFWDSLKASAKGKSTIHVSRGAAVRYTVEDVTGKTKSGETRNFIVLASSTFSKHGNKWLMTSHHASALPG
jgi:ketosteroid isomerase-like protein